MIAGKLRGVRLMDGRIWAADAVVVTTGTFLNGLPMSGSRSIQLRTEWRGTVAGCWGSNFAPWLAVDAA